MTFHNLTLEEAELLHIKEGDVVTLFAENVYLVLSTAFIDKHYIMLDMLDLLNGEKRSYGAGERWLIGRVVLT